MHVPRRCAQKRRDLKLESEEADGKALERVGPQQRAGSVEGTAAACVRKPLSEPATQPAFACGALELREARLLAHIFPRGCRPANTPRRHRRTAVMAHGWHALLLQVLLVVADGVNEGAFAHAACVERRTQLRDGAIAV